MPRAFIPIAPWTPDAGELRNPGMLELQGLAPWGGSYVPCARQQEYFDDDATTDVFLAAPSLATVKNGVHQKVTLSPNSGLLYFATCTKPATTFPLTSPDIYTLDTTAGAPWTKSSSLSGSVNLQWPPRFVVFGPHVLATQDGYGEMIIRLNESGNFAAAITTPASTPPLPRFGAAMGNRFVIANIADLGNHAGYGAGTYPSMVWSSATDNARIYTQGDTSTAARVRSGASLLDDGFGDITGMAGGREFGVIFKERQVYRVEFSGLGLEFYGISPGIGMASPNGWCWAGEDLYFWSNVGPVRLRHDRVEPIGQISRTLRDSIRGGAWAIDIPAISATENRVQCAFDPTMNLVVWALTPDHVMVYSPRTDELSLLSLNFGGELIGDTAGVGYEVLDLESALDSSADVPLGGVIFVGGNSSFAFADPTYFTRANGTAFGGTTERATGASEFCAGPGYYELNEGGTSRIVGVRPILEGVGSCPMDLRIHSRNTPWAGSDTDTVVTSAELTMTNGWIPTPSCPEACFHAIVMVFDSHASTVTAFKGFEVEYEEGSSTGGLA